MFMFTDVFACEIRRREVNEACRCACPDGIAPSKVSTSDDVCDDFLISAKIKKRDFSAVVYPEGRPVMSDITLRSGISGLLI